MTKIIKMQTDKNNTTLQKFHYYKDNYYQTSKLYLLVNKLILMQRTENSRKKLTFNG